MLRHSVEIGEKVLKICQYFYTEDETKSLFSPCLNKTVVASVFLGSVDIN